MNARGAIWLLIVVLLVGGGTYLAVRKPWLRDEPGSAKKTPVDDGVPPLFEEITESSGLDFVHWCGDGGKYFFPEVMGSGIALVDYDRDGDLDIFVVQGMPPKSASGRQPPAELKPSATSRLYRQGEDGRFADVTDEAGLADHEPYGMGVAAGDVNNDGWPDLYVSKFGRDRLWLNRQGRFEDVTDSAGIDNQRWGCSACFVDYDRDGWLDLCVVNYVDYFPSQRCPEPSGRIDYCHPGQFGDAPARLFRNVSGEGTAGDSGPAAAVRFRDVSLETGIDAKFGPGLGIVAGDFSGDGWIDFYAANDAKANFLWINRAGQKFEDEALTAGCACDAAGKPQSSMGVASGDVNGDGRRDLFMTHLDGEYSTLYLQVEEGIFEDRTTAAGLAAPTIPYTGFGTALVDIDLDGDLDIPIANGRVRRRDDVRTAPSAPAAFWNTYAERSQLFLGNGDGTFVEVAAANSPFCGMPRVARGLAVGDLDGDGDLDMVTSEINGPARVYRNLAQQRGNWLRVRAIDPLRGGRDAYGAVVTVVAGQKRWFRDVNPAYSYLSSSDPAAHFGLGGLASFDRIEVRWPDGAFESFPGGKANRTLSLERGKGAPQ